MIIAAYGEVLQNRPEWGYEVHDTALLPEKKPRIRAALYLVLDSAEDEQAKQSMRAALKMLAYFQDGVDGAAAIGSYAPNGRTYREIVETEVSATAFELARRGHGVAAN